ncbi:MAG TPA: hypothetical protein VK487_00545 [Candidatus Bathyarchaeia archaeon]|nr:hypothetical protein [Candidatus Bathyarchaeia archaeon]
MSSESIEDSLATFLIRKGYDIQSGSDFPSTIDILARKGGNLLLFEVKELGRIDSSDVARLKSLERLWNNRLGPGNRITRAFIIGKGGVTDETKEFAKELKIEIYPPDQITQVYQHKIFQEE